MIAPKFFQRPKASAFLPSPLVGEGQGGGAINPVHTSYPFRTAPHTEPRR